MLEKPTVLLLNTSLLTLLPNVWEVPPPHPGPSFSLTQQDVLQFKSILTLHAWRQHHFPQMKVLVS